MKRLLQWLVWMYPRSWRERYEKEFRTLLDATEPSWEDTLDLAKGAIDMQFRTGLLLNTLAFGIGAALLAGIALRITPATYESHAVIAMRTPNLFGSRVSAAEIYAVEQRVLSRDVLVRVMETFHLYEEDRAQGRTAEAVEKMRNGINVSSLLEQPALGLVSISFRNPDPLIARQVTQDLVSRFIDENIRTYAEVAATLRASEPPNVRIENIRTTLATLELVSPATEARHPSGPKTGVVIGVALAEGSQLGLIFALFRRFRAATVMERTNTGKAYTPQQ
jgi:uncharacterized protein involved in exopolysaccharide biosynthesis